LYIPLAILAGFVMVVGTEVIISSIILPFHLQITTGGIDRLMATPFWYRFMLVSRAAMAEEILFRGYPIERLEELTGSRLVAAAISWAAFTIAHHRLWGWNYLLVAGFLGAILTVLYLWRRNLYSNMIAHWIANIRFLLPY
jgi:membrane protease YdiL (CAAX protease family)